MPPAVGGPVGYTPPEGGWGWAVVLGAFISIGFSYAFPKSITVFFKDIEVIFDATPSQVSWISSIMLAVMYAGGEWSGVDTNSLALRFRGDFFFKLVCTRYNVCFSPFSVAIEREHQKHTNINYVDIKTVFTIEMSIL